jgi:excisionase family DNA binding protein
MKKQDSELPAPQAHTIKVACHLLGISRAHAYRLARSGELKTFRLGRRRLVSQSEINRLLGAAA